LMIDLSRGQRGRSLVQKPDPEQQKRALEALAKAGVSVFEDPGRDGFKPVVTVGVDPSTVAGAESHHWPVRHPYTGGYVLCNLELPPLTCSGGAQRDAPPDILDRVTAARVEMHRQAAKDAEPASPEESTT
jgi:hypothetical protein